MPPPRASLVLFDVYAGSMKQQPAEVDAEENKVSATPTRRTLAKRVVQ